MSLTKLTDRRGAPARSEEGEAPDGEDEEEEEQQEKGGDEHHGEASGDQSGDDVARAYDSALRRTPAARPALSKYSPLQPRVPRGNAEGGQWTTEGGGSLRVPATVRKPLDPLKPDTPLEGGGGGRLGPAGGGTSRAPSALATPGTVPRPRALEPGKPVQGQSEADVKRAQAELDRIIDGAKRRPDKDSPIFDRGGGASRAEVDFHSLPHVGNVRDVRSGFGSA